MPSPYHRDEFAESLERSLRRRAQPENLKHPALLPRREQRKVILLAIAIVLGFILTGIVAAALTIAIYGAPTS